MAPWRAFRMLRFLMVVVVMAVPFCACHATFILGVTGGCCSGVRSGAHDPLVAPSTVGDEPRSCCGRCGDGACNAKPVADEGEQDRPEPAPRPRPGCSGETCCVKSVPQQAPWQLPAPLFVAIVDPTAIVQSESSAARAIDWPPTLPLGQPPTPLDRGTLLLV